MRTPLVLETDAMKALQAYARQHQLALGKAASELVRRGLLYQLGTRKVNGLPVFDVPDHFPRITTHQVRELLDAAVR
jgi:hypothetical protein